MQSLYTYGLDAFFLFLPALVDRRGKDLSRTSGKVPKIMAELKDKGINACRTLIGAKLSVPTANRMPGDRKTFAMFFLFCLCPVFGRAPKTSDFASSDGQQKPAKAIL